MVEVDRAADIGENLCVGNIGLLGRLVQQTEDTFRRGTCRLQLRKNICHFVDGTGEAAAVLDKCRHIAKRHTTEHIQHRTEHRNQRQRQIVDEVDARTDHTALIVRFVVGIDRIVVVSVEAINDDGFSVVCLDGLLSRQHLLCIAVERTEHGRTAAEQGLYLLRFIAGKENRHRNGDTEDKQQKWGNLHHHDQRTDDGDKTGTDLDDIV